MKFYFLVLLLFFHVNVYSKELNYFKYLDLILKQNIDLKLQKKQIEQVMEIIKKNESFLVEPFKIDLQYGLGNYKIPFDYFNNKFPENQKIQQYVIGISKMIDVLNQQGTHKQISVLQKQLEIERELLLKKQIILQYRNAYFHLIFLQLIKDHLREHIEKFQKLKYLFQKNYFDKKLGYYTTPALNLGISTLQTEYNETHSMYQQEFLKIKNMLLESIDSLELDTISKVENLLPETLDKSQLLQYQENNPFIRIETYKLQIIEKNIELYKKLSYQNIEFFAYYLKKNQGNASIEQESQWNMGIRIPIPFGSEKMYDVNIQKKHYEMQQLYLVKTKQEVRNHIENAYNEYLNHYKQYKTNIKQLYDYEPYLVMLEESLLKRRISYFEYWGEHERFHNLLLLTAHSFQKAIENLSLLELYTGLELLKTQSNL